MLFESTHNQPLADRLRPQSLDDVFGQDEVIGEGQLLQTLLSQNRVVSLVLWGPPGVGKTTIARMLARNSNSQWVELSAVTSGVADIKKVIEKAHTERSMGRQLVLFIDEIHRFNKSQQDALLPHIENGLIVFIGATTENPSFEIIAPLLSRVRVVTLQPLTTTALKKIISNAEKHILPVKLSKKAKEILAEMSGGDARIALGALEVATSIAVNNRLTPKDIEQALQQSVAIYDKGGEGHYNLISAYIKSMRGGAVDAALFYLQRMLDGGEDPKFIARRLIIFASEDIGMAGSHALTLAVAGFQAIERIGLPEGNYVLTHLTIALSSSKKSRAVANAMYASKEAAQKFNRVLPPLHLRNAPTKLMKDLGYQKDYQWQAGFEHSEGFMPKELKDLRFYHPDKQ